MRLVAILAIIGSVIAGSILRAEDTPSKQGGKAAGAQKTSSADDIKKGESLHAQALRLRLQARQAHMSAQKNLQLAAKDQQETERLFLEAAKLDRQARQLLGEDPAAFELFQKGHREVRTGEMEDVRAKNYLALFNHKMAIMKGHLSEAKLLRKSAAEEANPTVKTSLETAAQGLEDEAKALGAEAEKAKADADKLESAAKAFTEQGKKDIEAAVKIDPNLEKNEKNEKSEKSAIRGTKG